MLKTSLQPAFNMPFNLTHCSMSLPFEISETYCILYFFLGKSIVIMVDWVSIY